MSTRVFPMPHNRTAGQAGSATHFSTVVPEFRHFAAAHGGTLTKANSQAVVESETETRVSVRT
ncbi:MAG: hypothetical protein O2955_09740 [Planctomycetota bacterium]|nr:hypothetical protein [Planctomycetota bacterium]MDA1212791.1 hypothetical protein [Planctomycetota bacterium]